MGLIANKTLGVTGCLHISIWKYVDYTTTSEVIKKGQYSEAHGIVNEIVNWSIRNRVKLNTDKCKELRISFTSDCYFPPVVIGEECIKSELKDAKPFRCYYLL